MGGSGRGRDGARQNEDERTAINVCAVRSSIRRHDVVVANFLL